MRKAFLIIAAGVILGAIAGVAHYQTAAPGHHYGGELVIGSANYHAFENAINQDGVNVRKQKTIMESDGGNRWLIEFDAITKTKGFAYGIYQGNQTQDNAKRVVFITWAIYGALVAGYYLIPYARQRWGGQGGY